MNALEMFNWIRQLNASRQEIADAINECLSVFGHAEAKDLHLAPIGTSTLTDKVFYSTMIVIPFAMRSKGKEYILREIVRAAFNYIDHLHKHHAYLFSSDSSHLCAVLELWVVGKLSKNVNITSAIRDAYTNGAEPSDIGCYCKRCTIENAVNALDRLAGNITTGYTHRPMV
jgi:hypothetical protein